jgi:hypothetical protein
LNQSFSAHREFEDVARASVAASLREVRPMNDSLAARSRATPRDGATRRARGAFKVGICSSFQLLDLIPTELHDVLTDAIITDAEDGS